MKSPARFFVEISLLSVAAGLIGFGGDLLTASIQGYADKGISQLAEQAEEVDIAVPRVKTKKEEVTAKAAQKTERIHQKEKTWPGFTLYPESGTALVHLVNMSGEVLHQWKFDAARARMLTNGNLLVVHGSKWGLDRAPWRQLRHNVREYDWQGNVAWEYITPGPAHHDVHRLANGNTLMMYRRELTDTEKAGIADPKKRGARIRTDIILEVTPTGEVAWDWSAHNHLDLNLCGAKPCRKLPKVIVKGKKVFDWTHANTITPLPENKWYDAGDKRFKPGNIMFMPRNMWEAMIIDKDTKEIVWKYHGDYKGGLSGGHEPHMIPKGLPGAGNVLIFDNGRERGFSVVLEINPSSNEIVWMYDVGGDLYSPAAGSIQRLPNGNTLISEDVEGRVIEVTSDKEIVWEYRGSAFRSCRAHRYEQGVSAVLKNLPLY